MEEARFENADKPMESSWAGPLPHCPGPPLREGLHSDPYWSANSDPHSSPLFSFLFLHSFSLLLSVSVLVSFIGPDGTMSPFDDVISVVVPQQTILSLKRKPSQQFLCVPFLNFVCLTLFPPVFVNDSRDLPLNVQEVFSRT